MKALNIGIDCKHPPSRLLRAAMWLTMLSPLLLFAMHAVAGEANATPGNLMTLDGLVGRWMDLRATIAAEQRAWQARRAQWEKEIDLLEKEADALEKERAAGKSFNSSVGQRRAVLLANKERMEAERRKLCAVLDRAEADLRRWRPRIPPGLPPALAAGFGALPATQTETDKRALVKRAQTVAALYSQIEALQNRMHATRETLEVDGKRRQVDVLYVGLAGAFAVSPGNDWAALGRPADGGWDWVAADNQAAVSIRRALEVLNRRETAELVTLPMQVAGEAAP